MSGERLPLGIFTTDDRLVVRTWDPWLAQATGIEPAGALGRELPEVLPEIRDRGFLPQFEEVLSRGTVVVLAPALHRYLVACAPSEPSSRFDRMQQHVSIGPLREQGRVVGTIVTIEDVTARVEREHQVAEQLIEDGNATRGASPAPGDPRPLQIESLTSLLDQDDWRVRRTAVATLAQYGSAIIDALVRTLRDQHENFNVLSSALDLLAMSDVDVVEPLAALLDHEDVNLRIQTALILGERRDPRAIPFLVARLSDPDVNVQFHVIEALGRLHATEAADALVAVAEGRDFFVAFPAIQALGRLGDPTVTARLVPLLADEMLRAPVVEALGELGDADVVVPLVGLLNASDAPTDVIATALAGLFDRYEHRYGAGAHVADLVRRHISATGTQNVLDAVQQAAPDRLPGLARVLGWLEGEAAHRALTRLLGMRTVRGQVVEALVRYGEGVVGLLVEQLRAEDLDTRQAAAVALGRIGERRATPALVAALQDQELAVPAAGALARIGDPDAFPALLALIGAGDAAVRQAAVAALNSIGHPGMAAHIVELLDGPDPIVRESALRIAGYFGYSECVDQVLARCRDDNEQVRRAAVEHLPFFEDARVLDALGEALASDTPAVRAAAAGAFARLDSAATADRLVQALSDSDAWVRYFALRSLGSVGDVSAVEAVTRVLHEDPAAHVRLAAIDVIGHLRPPHAFGLLEPLTRSENEDIARAAIRALGYLDQPDVLGFLEGQLRSDDIWRRLSALSALHAHTAPRVVQILQWVAAADETADVRQAAIDALTTLAAGEGDRSVDAARALTALTAEPVCRESAVAALSSLPVRRVQDIASGLRHSAVEVRRGSVEALSRMRRPEASHAIEEALDDVEASVRLTAVTELKHLGTRSSQRKLMILARSDPDSAVRRAAMHAVARAVDMDADPAGRPS